METFSVVFPRSITPNTFGEFMLANGAYVTAGVSEQYCVQRNDAAVYVSLENGL